MIMVCEHLESGVVWMGASFNHVFDYPFKEIDGVVAGLFACLGTVPYKSGLIALCLSKHQYYCRFALMKANA